MKKVVYGIVAASVVFAAQPVLADSTQFWNGARYQGVADLPFPPVSPGIDLARTVVAPGVSLQGYDTSRADADARERTRDVRDTAPARQYN